LTCTGQKQIDPHHLRNAAGIMAIGLVRLGFQECLGVTRLDADHRQAGFGRALEQPLRQWSGFKTDPFDLPGRVLEHPRKILRVTGNFHLAANRARFVHDAH
jgi:hypothetical protein